MDKSRQRSKEKRVKKHPFLVKSKKAWWREGLIVLFTIAVWFYCETVVFFFIDALFFLDLNYTRFFREYFKVTNHDIQYLYWIGGAVFILFYVLLRAWSVYNRKKYGGLRRRKYPKPTTKDELMKLNMLDENIYKKLQHEKVIVLEVNPIRNEQEIFFNQTFRNNKNQSLSG